MFIIGSKEDKIARVIIMSDIHQLSPQLLQILKFIQAFIHDQGYAPSVREIGKDAGISSTSTVHALLRKLENEGFLRRDPSKPRAMVVLNQRTDFSSDDRLPEVEKKPVTGHSEQPFFPDSYNKLPVVDDSAKNPNDTLNFHEDEELQKNDDTLVQSWLIPVNIVGNEPCFLMSMPDDSMINRQIYAGDLLLIHRQEIANSGDIVVGVIHNEVLIRTYFKGLRQVRLQAENDRVSVILTDHDELRIVGIIIGFVRMLSSS